MRKKVIELAVVVLAGAGGGVLLGQFLLGQGWWPVTVSGERETVVSGKLTKNAEDKFIGLKLVTDSGEIQVDMNRFKADTIYSMMENEVVARGVEREANGEKFIEVSWAAKK